MGEQLEVIITKMCSVVQCPTEKDNFPWPVKLAPLQTTFKMMSPIKKNVTICRIHYYPAENSEPKPLRLISVLLQYSYKIQWLKLITNENEKALVLHCTCSMAPGPRWGKGSERTEMTALGFSPWVLCETSSKIFFNLLSMFKLGFIVADFFLSISDKCNYN